jgi:hypothetical protein
MAVDIGEPMNVKNDQGKYVPYVYKVVNGDVEVKSGLISWTIDNRAENKVRAVLYGREHPEKYTEESKEERASEEISFLAFNSNIVELEYEDTIIEEEKMEDVMPLRHKRALLHVRSKGKNKEEIIPIRRGRALLRVTQVYKIKGKLESEYRQDTKEPAYLNITYTQVEGMPLSHMISVENLKQGSIREVHFDWTFPSGAPIAKMHLDDEGNDTVEGDCTDNLAPIGIVDNIRIMTKDNRLWLNEMTKFNKKKLLNIKISKSKMHIAYGNFDGDVLLEMGPTHTDDDPNEDGYVKYGNDTRFSVPPDDLMYIQGSSTAANRKRAFAEWNLSGGVIPAGSNILVVKMFVDNSYTNSNMKCLYKGLMTAPPSTLTGTAIWAGIDAGNLYADTYSGTYPAGPQKQVTLNANAVTAVQNMVNAAADPKWFAVGIRWGQSSGGSSYENGSREARPMAEEYVHPTDPLRPDPKPKLHVEY